MATQSFIHLKSEEKKLAAELLPKVFDPIGNYDARTRTHTRGYLLLCHAAFESYFEAEAKRIVKKAETIFDPKKRITAPLAHLLAYSDVALQIPDTVTDALDDALTDHVQKRIDLCYRTIRENNGIKESNLVRLFCPLGVPIGFFGTLLINELNSFGTDRGTHAHSNEKLLVNVIDPLTEYERVHRILDELSKFDKKLTTLHKRIK